MTNREWINNLSNEKLARFICDIISSKKICNYAYCNYINEHGGSDCDGDCPLGVFNWLTSEYKEEKI